MTGFYCPVEGCEKHRDHWDGDPPLETEGSVKGHINAMGDDDHREAREENLWQEAEPTDAEGDDDPDDQADDQQETSDDPPSEDVEEGGDQADDPDMSDPDADQWNGTSNETSDEGGKGTDGEGSSTSDDQAEKGGIPWVAVAAAGGLAAVAALVFGGSDDAGPSEPNEPEVSDPTDATPDGSDAISQQGGGLQ